MLLASVSAKQGAASGTATTLTSSPMFSVLLLGENGAVGTKILNGCTFILNGTFNEVSTPKAAAEEGIKKMLKS